MLAIESRWAFQLYFTWLQTGSITNTTKSFTNRHLSVQINQRLLKLHLLLLHLWLLLGLLNHTKCWFHNRFHVLHITISATIQTHVQISQQIGQIVHILLLLLLLRKELWLSKHLLINKLPLREVLLSFLLTPMHMKILKLRCIIRQIVWQTIIKIIIITQLTTLILTHTSVLI